MSIISEAIWAASPSTNRGQPTILSSNPKGDRIAYASNKSIFLRSIDHPEISTQYTAHTTQTTVARFAPSGNYVASGDVAGTVRVWDCVGEGATKGEYHIIAGRINDIAWDGDSQRIIAVGDGKERFGHCITADSGNSVGEISGHSSQINCVSIRQQRPLRAMTGSDDTSLVFYHGAPFKFNTSLRGQHNKFVYGTAFSPDGATVVSVGSDRRVWLYDGKTGEPRHQIGDGEHKGTIFGVAWAQDSKRSVTASADQTVKVWDVEAGKVVQSWRMGDENVVSVSDQQMGVVWPHSRSDGLFISVDLEGNLNYFTEGNTRPIRIVRGHQRNITAASFTSRPSEDSSTLWTGSSDGRVRCWSISEGIASRIDGQGHSAYVYGLALSNSSSSSNVGDPLRLYSVGWDDTLRTIDVATQAFLSSTAKLSGQPKGIAVSGIGRVLVATTAGVEVHNADELSAGQTIMKGFTPTAIAASPVANITAAGADDKTLRIYGSTGSDLNTDAAIVGKDILTSVPSVLAFSHDGDFLAVGTSGGQIVVFKTSDWSVATSRWSSHTARVTCISWSKNGKHAVSGSLDTNLHIWSLMEPGKRIKAGNAHKEGVNGVVWVEASKIISVGADAAVKVWKIQGIEH